ncbi:Uma2 family endonuclease [Xenococcus sp. PCC 7305]|uniref:Uma2 family endonuclease n=1 Tax=Xenococcus sp. PCC 7305 TaxID=102125 RepID=UPI0005937B4B
MNQVTTEKVRWTTSDIELLSQDEGKRYEIIDGELFVTRSPHWNHQRTIDNICLELNLWSRTSGLGEARSTPGIIFSDVDNVEPDVVWISKEKLITFLDDSGHLTGAPELVIEVLSPGKLNERRDKEAKLKLYSSQGVQEYWIVSWQLKTVEVYRRENLQLKLIATLFNNDQLTSALLPNFECEITRFFI